ncbi:MAG: patatin-like phospholipase family protein [Aquificae bacterium]|nr:patatin-like phospholipase family protein [Aquificota bacterium]
MRINLVLSGGAARGIAHIGVLKALEEMGFKVKALSGSSAGAIVSVFYSYGYSPEEMMGLIQETKWFSLFRPKIPRSGLFSLKKSEDYLRKLIKTDRIEDLSKRVFICTTDLLSARPLYFSKGDLVPILLGSCALPGIFEPVRYGEYLFVDGGVMNNLPVEPFERYKTLKVGVDVNPIERVEEVSNVVSILIRSFFLAVRSNVDKRKELCDVVITPDIVEFSPLDVRKARELYRLGYEKTLRVMERFLD